MKFKKYWNCISGNSEFLWLMTGQIVSILFSFVVIKLITKIGTSEFGVYSLILTICGLVSAILIGPSEQGFVRYFFNFEGAENKKRFLNVIYLFFISTISLLSIISIWFYFIKLLSNPNILLIGLFVIFFTFSSFFSSIFNLIRKRKLNTILIVLEKAISAVLLYSLKIYEVLNITNVLIVLIVSIVVSLFLRINFLNSKFDYKLFRDLKIVGLREYVIYKKIFLFSIPFIIWGLSGWLQSSSDRWVIAHYSNMHTVGIYSLMMTLSSYLIATPIGVVGQYFQPIIFEKIGDKSKTKNEIKKYILTCVILVLFGVAISLLLGKVVLSFIAISFTSFWYFLPFFSLSVGLFQIAQCYTVYGVVSESPKIYLLPKILIGVISLLLNILGVYFFQIIGLTISMIITSTIYLLMIMVANKKQLLKNEDITYS
jgi:O-antigen/teichoic acid export membrane protein